jgi:hypothetical protein
MLTCWRLSRKGRHSSTKSPPWDYQILTKGCRREGVDEAVIGMEKAASEVFARCELGTLDGMQG